MWEVLVYAHRQKRAQTVFSGRFNFAVPVHLICLLIWWREAACAAVSESTKTRYAQLGLVTAVLSRAQTPRMRAPGARLLGSLPAPASRERVTQGCVVLGSPGSSMGRPALAKFPGTAARYIAKIKNSQFLNEYIELIRAVLCLMVFVFL